MTITRSTASSPVRSNRPIRPKFRQRPADDRSAATSPGSARQGGQGSADDYLAIENAGDRRELPTTPAYLKAAFALNFEGPNPKLDERREADKLSPGRLRRSPHAGQPRREYGKANPVFGPWHAFAGLPADDFCRKAPGMSKALASADPKVPNPVVAQAFAARRRRGRWPKLPRYGDFLSQVSQRWDAPKANPKANALPDADWEASTGDFWTQRPTHGQRRDTAAFARPRRTRTG